MTENGKRRMVKLEDTFGRGRFVALSLLLIFGSFGYGLYQNDQQNDKIRGGVCGFAQAVAAAPIIPGQVRTSFGDTIRAEGNRAAQVVECTPDPYDGK